MVTIISVFFFAVKQNTVVMDKLNGDIFLPSVSLF